MYLKAIAVFVALFISFSPDCNAQRHRIYVTPFVDYSTTITNYGPYDGASLESIGLHLKWQTRKALHLFALGNYGVDAGARVSTRVNTTFYRFGGGLGLTIFKGKRISFPLEGGYLLGTYQDESDPELNIETSATFCRLTIKVGLGKRRKTNIILGGSYRSGTINEINSLQLDSPIDQSAVGGHFGLSFGF